MIVHININIVILILMFIGLTQKKQKKNVSDQNLIKLF
jgi:hypothetical protein